MPAIANNLSGLAAMIRDRRKSLRLTQHDLADLCGVQRQTIERLEAAGPTVAAGTAMAVADALGLRHSLGAEAATSACVAAPRGCHGSLVFTGVGNPIRNMRSTTRFA